MKAIPKLLIQILVAALLVFTVVQMVRIGGNGGQVVDVKVDTVFVVKMDTVFISSPPVKEKYVPESVKDSLELLIAENEQLRNQPPDTVIKYLVKEYFTINEYDTLLINDSLLYARAKMQIHRNSLLNLTFDYKTYSKTITTKETVSEGPRNHFFLGASARFNNEIVFHVDILNKKDWMIGAGYSTDKVFEVGVRKKLW